MRLPGPDSEIEVQGAGGQPAGDLFRPLDGKAPWRLHEVLQQQVLDLAGGSLPAERLHSVVAMLEGDPDRPRARDLGRLLRGAS